MSANKPEESLKSHYFTHDVEVQFCKDIFGFDETYTGPNTDWTNNHYKGLEIEAEHIVFVNSKEDPWQWAGMRKIEHPDPIYEMIALYNDCDGCSHCSDLYPAKESDPAILTANRKQIFD